MILGDQKRLEVQPYTRFRIVDPLRFYQALRTLDQARAQLAQLVSSSVRRELGQVPLLTLLTPQRGDIVDVIKTEVAAKARPLGVEIDEVRFHRADLPFETSQAIYDRMKSERQREAKELRAQGSEWAQQIQSRADRERTVLLSEAQRAAAISRGEGDAEANRVLAEAFDKDPSFYQFYRALRPTAARSPIPARRWCCLPTPISCGRWKTGRIRRKARQRRRRRGARRERRGARAARPNRRGVRHGPLGRRRLALHPAADLRRRPAARRRQRAADRGRLQRPQPAGRAPRGDDRRRRRDRPALASGVDRRFAARRAAGQADRRLGADRHRAQRLRRARCTALPTREPGAARGDLWAAAAAIVVADAAMSLDNVVALAAIARGNFWLLAAGVVLSIPVLAYGGLVLSAALRAAPWLVKLGAALLGWIAGDMAVTDPLVGGWIAVNAPALAAIAPALGAAFVFFAGPSAQPPTPAPSAAARPALAPLPSKPAAATLPPPRPRPKLVAAEAASAKLAAAEPKPPPSEPPEREARSESERSGLSPEDRFAVIGVLVLTLIAGIVLMLVSYLDSVN